MLRKVISGGQSGADMAGLIAAKIVGIKTGGTAPPGWISGNKCKKSLLKGFGLVEGEPDERVYPKRTMKNVDDSDGTIAFRFKKSPGTDSTIRYAISKKWGAWDGKLFNNQRSYRPVLIIPDMNDMLEQSDRIRDFIRKRNIEVLNVAGHRGNEDFERQIQILLTDSFFKLMNGDG